jgi:uncharacterized coiled-coil protein SlyX
MDRIRFQPTRKGSARATRVSLRFRKLTLIRPRIAPGAADLSRTWVDPVKLKNALVGETCSWDCREPLMDQDPDEKILQLEASIAHLERQYDELNGVVVEQGRELNRLRLQLQKTSATMESIEMDRIKSNNPKPPHSVI